MLSKRLEFAITSAGATEGGSSESEMYGLQGYKILFSKFLTINLICNVSHVMLHKPKSTLPFLKHVQHCCKKKRFKYVHKFQISNNFKSLICRCHCSQN